MYVKCITISFLSVFFLFCKQGISQTGIRHDARLHTIILSSQDKNINLCIDYATGCHISKLLVRQKNVLSPQGAYTGYTINTHAYASNKLTGKPSIRIKDNKVIIDNIRYGDSSVYVIEKWIFNRLKDKITWKISRKYFNDFVVEDISFPMWNFKDMSVWKGGIINNGGMVWCKYLGETGDTYGVHTGGTIFWNDQSGDGLSIEGKGWNNEFIATKYSHGKNDEFVCTQSVSHEPFEQRYRLDRFVRGKANVFIPVTVKKEEEISATFEIKYIDYFKAYDKGDLKNIDATAVRELMNTTARYGVVDNNITGGNGWLTNWKCLHEPFFGQIALGLADSNYTKNLAATLDQERDLAMLPNGRVLSRWHNEDGDEMPGTYNFKTGYYEAKWGYTIDAQTGYVINTSDLFNLTGDLEWLKNHRESCEKALNWLIKRDSNRNGIFEMMNKNIREHTSSDWLDIIWASYENAFVNAQMYDALQKWSVCEKVLGNMDASNHYKDIAEKLKTAFNKPIEDGGFWDAGKKQYVYWRDDDGSIHGDNLVTPVQFMAIASGLCDDKQRIKLILDQIEQRTSAEHLFHWPLCFDSFKQEEAASSNFPFPSYENGDIFPTWGYLGIASYVKYDKTLALKYITNLLGQYRKDGLSSQRYSRTTQQGLGSDVLAGISTSICALYSDIYGVQPQWNRFVLNPHLVPDLYGTNFHYQLRGTDYNIQLNENNYTVSTENYSVSYIGKFGVNEIHNGVNFYPVNADSVYLSVRNSNEKRIKLDVQTWSENNISFRLNNVGKYSLEIHGLQPSAVFYIKHNGSKRRVVSDKKGTLLFNENAKAAMQINITKA
ncbi:MAG: hypothetical protein PW786_02160 [Arachidicoccus sp.]|nr:hypothetical protein [Arachidicoccus sp.]